MIQCHAMFFFHYSEVTRSSLFYFHRRIENVWPPVGYANIYTSFKKTAVNINLKYHTVVHECFGNIKIRERFSLSNKFPTCRFLLSCLNDNVFAVRPAYNYFWLTKERSSEDK